MMTTALNARPPNSLSRAGRRFSVAAIALCAGAVAAQQPPTTPSVGTESVTTEELHIRVEQNLISLRARNADLQEVIERVAALTNLAVIANGPLDGRLDLQIRQLPLERAFRKMLRTQNYVLHQAGSWTPIEQQHRPRSAATLWIYSQRPWPNSRTVALELVAPEALRSAVGAPEQEITRAQATSTSNEHTDSFESLISALGDTDPRVREEAVWALGKLGDDRVLDALQRAMADMDAGVREVAIEAFADMGGEEAARSLEVALTYEEKSLRMDAMDALGEIGGETAKLLLERALSDPEPHVRDVASEMLAEL